MNFNKKITFIGGGNMAQCLIGGLFNKKYDMNLLTVSTPHIEKVNQLMNTFKINGTTSNADASNNSDIIVLAIKPQVVKDALENISNSVDFSNKLIISIMAGVTIERIKQLLPGAEKIVRVMPNTPALIELGMSGIYFSNECDVDDISITKFIFENCGKITIVNEENKIDEITAISGSAPAYFFMFMECLINKAISYGFSEDEAKNIITQVALGSTQMVIKNNDKTISELRNAVTSKGGTTYEALKVFENRELSSIVDEALDACKNRAKELSKLF
ncbi:MAG: pyrroline-5-carboxylate reductase [Succinivibrionaceae bacterium]